VEHSAAERRWLSIVMLAPVALQSLGALIAHCAHVGVRGHVVSAAIGLVYALVIGFAVANERAIREPIQRSRGAIPWLLVAVVALTLVTAGRDGVRRWLPLGPFSLHASAVLAPWVLRSLRDGVVRGHRRALLLALCLQCVHLAQPDFGQAAAFALGSLVLVARGPLSIAMRALFAASMLALAAVTVLRRDPLEAVDSVERIVALAAELGPAWLLASVAAMLAYIALVARGPRAPDALSLSLAAYGACAALVAVVTERFPVPWLGAGAGPVIGAMLSAAALFTQRSDARDDHAR
jgi:cell division protein FtsW (lipid II flippase)